MSDPEELEEILQSLTLVVVLDARQGMCLDSDEYPKMIVKNPAEAMYERLKYSAKSIPYEVDENDPTKVHKLFDKLVEEYNSQNESNPLRRVSFKEMSSKNETMRGLKKGDRLALAHDVGVACGSRSEYPDFECHSLVSWAECYFEKHGRPKYKDGMGVFPQ